MTNLTKNKDTLHFDCRDHKLNFQAGKEGMTEPWMNGNLKKQFWMNKIFLDVTNSVVPQTTAEALVSSETPPLPSLLWLCFQSPQQHSSQHAAARSSNTPHCEDHVHRKLKHLPHLFVLKLLNYCDPIFNFFLLLVRVGSKQFVETA